MVPPDASIATILARLDVREAKSLRGDARIADLEQINARQAASITRLGAKGRVASEAEYAAVCAELDYLL